MPHHRCIGGVILLVFRLSQPANASTYVPLAVEYARQISKHKETTRKNNVKTDVGAMGELRGESNFQLLDEWKDNETPLHDASVLGRDSVPVVVPNKDESHRQISAQPYYHESRNNWSTSSFLGGIAVGVLCSLLFIGCFLDVRLNTSSSLDKEKVLQQTVKTRDPEITKQEPSSQSSSQFGLEKESVEQLPSQRADLVEESLHLYWPRLGCLVILLLIQSISSIVLSGFQDLVVNQPSLIFFLTMIVGLGGNAGCQSVVLTVRRLALGQKSPILEQLTTGILLSLVIAPLSFFRALAQGTKVPVCSAIGVSVFFITILATTSGTALPQIFVAMKIDPAHATPVIQVLMDIIGIMIVCGCGVLLL